MNFNQDEFNKFVKKNVLQEGLTKLKNGEESNNYFNWRNILKNHNQVYSVMEYIINFTLEKKLEPDCFYGVPEGMNTLATLTQNKWIEMNVKKNPSKTYRFPLGRKESKKDYGKEENKDFVCCPDGKIIILEDTLTTGGSLIKNIDKVLELENVKIIAIYGLTDRIRKNSDRRKIESLKIPYHPLSYEKDILLL